MSREIHKLLHKKNIPLKEQLYSDLVTGKITSEYIFPEGKHEGEPSEEYIKRLANESSRYQFVKVTYENQEHYVAFGVPGPIITKEGKFILISAEVVGGKWGTHYFLGYPNLAALKDKKNILLRLDSGCHSGMVLGDITCDCADQLHKARKLCIENKSGIIMHMPGHDGRGWGDYKMANQRIMDELGLDTVTTARKFYGDEEEIDQRTYIESVIVLRALGFNEKHIFNLATNNPQKISAFLELGMNVSSSCSVVSENISDIASKNLMSKSKNWNHNLQKSNTHMSTVGT